MPSHVVDKNDPTNVELDIRLRSRPEAENVADYCAILNKPDVTQPLDVYWCRKGKVVAYASRN